jgi:hypothetical protein
MLLLLVCVVAVVAQPRVVVDCQPGFVLSSTCVVAETISPDSWEGKVRAWCKTADQQSYHPIVSLDYQDGVTDEAVRIIATLREMRSATDFLAPSRYGVSIKPSTFQASLSSQASVGNAAVHPVCVATGANFNSAVSANRKNLIDGEKSIRDNGFKTQAEISPAFICVADKGRDACNNKAVVRSDDTPFPGGPLPAEFSTGKYIRCSLNSFTIEAFTNGKLDLVIREMSFGRGPATGPLMHRTFISGELNIQRHTVEVRKGKLFFT